MKKFKNIKSIFSPKIIGLGVSLSLLLLVGGCKKLYNLPEDLDYLSERADYNTKVLSPVIGRTTLYSNIFNHDESSLPLTFEIVNFRDINDVTSNDLSVKRPTWVWTQAYTGLETSIQEIEAKRKLEDKPAFEVLKSGDFVLWASTTNADLPNFQGETDPDKAAGYKFDVRIGNSGGSRVLTDFTLRPYRSRAYEPSGRNALTGLQTSSINPDISGMIGATTGNSLSNSHSDADSAKRDVRVIFTKIGNGKSLTFRFLDKNMNPIEWRKFNKTKWGSLVHGFNIDSTKADYIKYDVAYPIPLTAIPTKYTISNGSQAALDISYDRLGFNGIRQTGRIKFNFNIFEQGDWEIKFQFRNENPKFEDE